METSVFALCGIILSIFTILDYELTEGRDSILSFAGGFGMVPDEKTVALTFKNGVLKSDNWCSGSLHGVW